MDTRIIVILAILSIIIVACSIRLLKFKKPEKLTIINDSIFDLFEPSNIINIEFVRNKVVVSFKDASLFNVNKLKEYGGKGISVIGDKIKFFISEKSQENENLYNHLAKQIER